MTNTGDPLASEMLTLVADTASTDVRVEITLPLLAILCWTLLVYLVVSPRRRRDPPRSDPWYPADIGPPPDSDGGATADNSDRSRGGRRQTHAGAEFVTRVRPTELPTLVDVVGHRLAAEQLDDLVGPVLAGRRAHPRWCGVLVHGGAPADAAMLIRAVAGEHEVPLLIVRVRTLARSLLDSATEAVFAHVRAQAPCVLALIDLHELTSDGPHDPALRRVSSDLLTQLRRIPPTEHVAVIGLVDHPNNVPRSLRDAGGFGRDVTIGLATSTERERIIRREMLLQGAVFDSDLAPAVRLTDGLTASEVRDAVGAAAGAVRARVGFSNAPPTVTLRDLREGIAATDAPQAMLSAFGPTIGRRLRDLLDQLDDRATSPALVLHGASGNGKTTAARWVAERCDRRVIWISGRDLALLPPVDLETVVRDVAVQTPALVIVDGLDITIEGSRTIDKKRLVAAAERLLAVPGVGLVIAACELWTPGCSNLLDDLVESAWIRHPTHRERALLIQHVSPTRHPSDIAVLAAQLHGATRRDVVLAAVND